MKNRSYLLVFGIVLLAAGLRAQESSTYCNNRFGFCVSYPAALKLSDDGPANGDGIILEAGQGMEVAISGSFNVMGWTPERIFEFALEDLSADLGAEIEPIEPRIDEDGFETRFTDGRTYQYARMWSLGDTYLVITVTGPEAEREQIEVLKDKLIPTFGS